MRSTLKRLLHTVRGAPDHAPVSAESVRDVVTVVRDHLADHDGLIVVLGPRRVPLLDALQTACPRCTVVVPPAGVSERHVELALLGPPDAIIDLGRPRGRLHRFRTTFFALRPGGLYVIPDGGDELGSPNTGTDLGAFLAAAALRPARTLRRVHGYRLEDSFADVARMHLTARASGAHLVLSHDLPGVLAKLDESEVDAWIDRSPGLDRVLHRIPAEAPPDADVIAEGPRQRTPSPNGPISAAPIRLRDYREAVVGVEQLVVTDRVLPPDTFRHNQRRVLRNRGVLDVGPRHGILAHPLPPDLPRLEGAYLHLDNEVRGHFGHAMTEVLSRMWSWPAAQEIDPDVRVLVSASRGRPELADWEYRLYEAGGVPRDRIVRIDRAVRVERLLSGSPMLSNPEYIHPRIVETWDRVGDALAARTEARARPGRLFVGRRIRKRACTNGAEVEAIFADYGFEIVYPEEHSLGEQVALFRAADVIAGYAGSGMFHIAMVPRPTHVIQVCSESYRARNEVLMAAARGHRIDAVVCRANSHDLQSTFTFDVEQDGAYLRSILDRLPRR